ncbi:MAG: glucose-6-phosphate dehydrogenase [Candidatus Wildermuthbacteria bacterium]|nr:glucose-6-phosphate dehydrogenase [Candidatus Wildermuthbacteria bacterium]
MQQQEPPRKDSLLPTVFVIFGATGDLMQKKLAPSLFYLHKAGLLPALFQIVGFARQPLSNEEFRERVKKTLEGNVRGTSEEIEQFSRFFVYQQGFFEQKEGYEKLAYLLGKRDDEWKVCSNKLFHLAVPPSYYKQIFQHLVDSGLTKPCSPEEGWTRVILEKPFGKDLETAEELDRLSAKLFKEEQIYRIDHYLGKETVQNILAFRFSNFFLQDSWNKDSIESISIQLLEQNGVSGRGEFYDGIGALRDVGQNHMLQLLALFCMENPETFDGESLRKARAKLLESLHMLHGKDIQKETVRGQYAGYLQEEGVRPDSATETYFKIHAFLKTPRWEGMPVILESGKSVSQDKAEVVITFKHSTPCLCPKGTEHAKNVLRYQIQPEERISISLYVKRPGTEMKLEERSFEFDYRKAFEKEEFQDAYAKLLLSCIKGDQTLFVSSKEIEASWRFIDPIVRAWQDNKTGSIIYKQGTLPVIRTI